jgi:hypothetical protein
MGNRFAIPGCLAKSKKHPPVTRYAPPPLSSFILGYPTTLLQKVRHLASYSRIAN